MKEITIGAAQARSLAMAIFSDIEEYIKSHQDEYEAFLREEEKEQTKGEE